jgi:hypothetical protein
MANFDPVSDGQDANAATINGPLSQLDAAIEAILDGSTGFDRICLNDGSALTIASGAVTATHSYHTIEAETGTTDDLDTINQTGTRSLLIIDADSGDTITVKNGTGNIYTRSGSDVALSGEKCMMLFKRGSNWAEV